MEMPLLFVAEVRCFLGRLWARSKAYLQDPVHAGAGHDGFLDHRFAVGAFEDLPADAGVFAFGVFAHDVEVDIARDPPGQRAGHAGQEFDRAEADVLVEVAAELQEAAPQ